jgi:hypothetical protein
LETIQDISDATSFCMACAGVAGVLTGLVFMAAGTLWATGKVLFVGEAAASGAGTTGFSKFAELVYTALGGAFVSKTCGVQFKPGG